MWRIHRASVQDATLRGIHGMRRLGWHAFLSEMEAAFLHHVWAYSYFLFKYRHLPFGTDREFTGTVWAERPL